MNDKDKALEALGDWLDFESYEWLQRNHPDAAEMVENAIACGASVDEIKIRAWKHTRREEIVRRLTSAARHLTITDYQEESR